MSEKGKLRLGPLRVPVVVTIDEDIRRGFKSPELDADYEPTRDFVVGTIAGKVAEYIVEVRQEGKRRRLQEMRLAAQELEAELAEEGEAE